MYLCPSRYYLAPVKSSVEMEGEVFRRMWISYCGGFQRSPLNYHLTRGVVVPAPTYVVKLIRGTVGRGHHHHHEDHHGATTS